MGRAGIVAVILSIAAMTGSGPSTTADQQQRAVSMQPRIVLAGPGARVRALAFSPDGRLIATGDREGRMWLWNAVTGEQRATLIKHKGPVYQLAFSSDGRTLASGSEDETVSLFDTTTARLKAVLKGHKRHVSSLAFSPYGRTLATAGSDDRRPRLWDTETGRLITTLPALATESYEWVNDVAYSSDGRTLAAGSNVAVYLLDAATLRLKATLSGHSSTIYTFFFSPDGQMIGTVSRDQTARLWDVGTGRMMATLGHDRAVIALAFSPDGRTVATGSVDKTAKVWDVATGKLKATLTGHGGDVWSVTFSPDGRTIATASDKTVRLWEATSGLLKATLEGARDPIAFSPDGRTLATASKKDTALLWDVP